MERIVWVHIGPRVCTRGLRARRCARENEWYMPQCTQPSLMTHLIERLESTERDWCQIHESPLNSEPRGLIVCQEEGITEREGTKTGAILLFPLPKGKLRNLVSLYLLNPIIYLISSFSCMYYDTHCQ